MNIENLSKPKDAKQVISLSCLADSHPPATITWYQLTPNKQVNWVRMIMIVMIMALMIVIEISGENVSITDEKYFKEFQFLLQIL